MELVHHLSLRRCVAGAVVIGPAECPRIDDHRRPKWTIRLKSRDWIGPQTVGKPEPVALAGDGVRHLALEVPAGQTLHRRVATRIEHDTKTVVPRSPDSEYHSTIDDDCPELTCEYTLVGGVFRGRTH